MSGPESEVGADWRGSFGINSSTRPIEGSRRRGTPQVANTPHPRETKTRPVVAVQWTCVGGEDVRRRARRRLIESLFGLPQPADDDAPVALAHPTTAPGSGNARELSQVPAAISYRQIQRRLSLSGWSERGGFDAALVDEIEKIWAAETGKVADSGRRAAQSETMSRPRRLPDSSKPPRRPAVYYHRPGEGGRHKRVGKVSPREAAQELVPVLGEFREFRGPDSSRVYVWDALSETVSDVLDRNGTGVLMTRKSTEETQAGQTTRFGQFDPCWDLAQSNDKGIRMVIVAESLPGTWDPEFRLDWQILLQAMRHGGWVEDVFYNSGDRIARDLGPAEWFYTQIRRERVSLWLAGWNRAVRWTATDKLQLRIENSVAAYNRDELVQKMRSSKLLQGPLAGNGLREAPPFGFRHDPAKRHHVEDPVQMGWVHRAFALAHEAASGEGASTYQIADRLREEGCPFDHDRIRTLLSDPIYVTGEYTVNVSGLAIAQEPLSLSRPVSALVFQEVQDILRLRRARTDRTPLGEFALNYVRFSHAKCDGHVKEITKPDGKIVRQKALIKGYTLNVGASKYRHSPYCPEQCRRKGYVWEREELEHPVIDLLRRALQDPELLATMQERVQYEVTDWDPTLGKADREELERNLKQLQVRLEEAQREFAEATVSRDGESSVDLYTEIVGVLRDQIQHVERRLEDDREIRQRAEPSSLHRLRREQRLDAALEILSYDVPTDPRLRRIRARLIQEMISEIILHEDDQGRTWLEVKGHLRPPDLPALQALDPLDNAGAILDTYLARRDLNTQAGVPSWLSQDDEATASARTELPDETWHHSGPVTRSKTTEEGGTSLPAGPRDLRVRAAAGNPESLDQLAHAKANAERLGILEPNKPAPTRTDSEARAIKSVRVAKEALIDAPSGAAQKKQERGTLESTAFRYRHQQMRIAAEGGSPSWIASVAVDEETTSCSLPVEDKLSPEGATQRRLPAVA